MKQACGELHRLVMDYLGRCKKPARNSLVVGSASAPSSPPYPTFTGTSVNGGPYDPT